MKTVKECLRECAGTSLTMDEVLEKVTQQTGCSRKKVSRAASELRTTGVQLPYGKPGAKKQKALSSFGPATSSVVAPPPKTKIPLRLNAAISVSSIVKEHDLPAKLREALALLRKNRQVIPESGLRADLHVDANKFARAATLPEFAEFRRELRGKIYWGAPADLTSVENAMEGVYE